jgi:hypothetical protein
MTVAAFRARGVVFAADGTVLRWEPEFFATIGDAIRAGRIPGNQEKSMSSFKFRLGDLVVLSSSLATAHAEAAEKDAAIIAEAARAAQAARNNVLYDAGRGDLIERKVARGESSWAIAEMRPPVEGGEIIGRSEYSNSCNNYYVRYRAGDGRQTETWLAEDAIALDPRSPREERVSDQDDDRPEVDGADRTR